MEELVVIALLLLVAAYLLREVMRDRLYTYLGVTRDFVRDFKSHPGATREHLKSELRRRFILKHQGFVGELIAAAAMLRSEEIISDQEFEEFFQSVHADDPDSVERVVAMSTAWNSRLNEHASPATAETFRRLAREGQAFSSALLRAKLLLFI